VCGELRREGRESERGVEGERLDEVGDVLLEIRRRREKVSLM